MGGGGGGVVDGRTKFLILTFFTIIVAITETRTINTFTSAASELAIVARLGGIWDPAICGVEW